MFTILSEEWRVKKLMAVEVPPLDSSLFVLNSSFFCPFGLRTGTGPAPALLLNFTIHFPFFTALKAWSRSSMRSW